VNRECRLEVRIPSRYQSVGLVRRVLSSLRPDLPLDPDAFLKLEICVVEAVGNAIRHAYARCGDGTVEVELTLGSGQLVVQVSDHGRPMSARDRDRLTRDEAPVDADPADGGRPAGLGFPLLRAALDSLDYTSGNGRNTLRMKKLLPSLPSAVL